MNKKSIAVFIMLGMVVVAITVSLLTQEHQVQFSRCMNIGNALDAPKDIPWDVEMKTEYFDSIKSAGFDCVRLPVRFSDYAKDQPNYILQEKFMKEMDAYLNYAMNNGLVVILDFHHFIELMDNPDKYKGCFLSIWRQISERYKDDPDKLVFELLNEPTGQLKGELWNRYIAEAVTTIRTTNKDRMIIVGPDQYNSIDGLKHLSLPKDKNIKVSFHFYEPNDFTFQGNQYHAGFENLHDIPWKGTAEEVQKLRDRFGIVKKWAAKHDVDVFMGEFGANRNAPADSRILWTYSVRKLAEEMGFSWGYWELCSSFGVMDAQTLKWDEKMLDALMKDK